MEDTVTEAHKKVIELMEDFEHCIRRFILEDNDFDEDQKQLIIRRGINLMFHHTYKPLIDYSNDKFIGEQFNNNDK